MADRRSALDRIKGTIRVYDPSGKNLQREIEKTKYPVNNDLPPISQLEQGSMDSGDVDTYNQNNFDPSKPSLGRLARSVGEQGPMSDADVQNFQAPGNTTDPKLNALKSLMTQMDELRQKSFIDSLGNLSDDDLNEVKDQYGAQQKEYQEIQDLKKQHESNLGRSLNRDEYQDMLDNYYNPPEEKED